MQKISREESTKFFGEVVPALCGLLLQLPSMLETHYQNADHVLDGVTSGLRLLAPQEAGVVFLSQELIVALLACSFFCLFPEADRRSKHLQSINFDDLFSYVGSFLILASHNYTLPESNKSYFCFFFLRFPFMSYCSKRENKIRCLLHYFERVCQCMPTGFVSFERKVLPRGHKHNPHYVSYPEAEYWAKSTTPLCSVEVTSKH